jgi:hypothetical protein
VHHANLGGERLQPTQRHGAITLVVLAAACSSGDGARGAFTTRDSAGIAIVTSTRAEWTDSTAWQVAAEPMVDIGSVEGDPERELFRVAGAVRTPEGIAVANAGTGEIRFYADDGTLLRRVGGRGEGPGEFASLTGLWLFRRDSLLAWDERLRRWSVHSLTGDFARVILPERSGLNPTSLPPLDDGSLVLQDLWLDVPDEQRRTQYHHYTHVSSDGRFLDSLPRLPAFDAIPVEGLRIFAPIFAARSAATASGDGIWWGRGDAYAVDEYAADGALLRRVRWQGPERSVTSDHIAAYKESETETIRDENRRREFAAALETLPVETAFPAFVFMLRDRTSHLWLFGSEPPGDPQPSWSWTVLAPDGRWLGPVAMPRSMLPFDIGEDFVVGSAFDIDDVEHVRVYRLDRRSGGSPR